jgi:hypothetical protein
MHSFGKNVLENAFNSQISKGCQIINSKTIHFVADLMENTAMIKNKFLVHFVPGLLEPVRIHCLARN